MNLVLTFALIMLAGSIVAQQPVAPFVATTYEVADGQNQTKPVTPYSLAHSGLSFGGGNLNAGSIFGTFTNNVNFLGNVNFGGNTWLSGDLWQINADGTAVFNGVNNCVFVNGVYYGAFSGNGALVTNIPYGSLFGAPTLGTVSSHSVSEFVTNASMANGGTQVILGTVAVVNGRLVLNLTNNLPTVLSNLTVYGNTYFSGTNYNTNSFVSALGFRNYNGGFAVSGTDGTITNNSANGIVGSGPISTSSQFNGNGGGMTNVNGGAITGTVPLITLPAAVVTNNATGLTLAGTFTGTLSGNGASVTNLNGSSVTGSLTNNTSGNSKGATNFYGTVASSQVTGLSSNVLGNVLSYSSGSNVVVDLSKYTNQIRVGLVLTLTNNTMIIFTNPAPAFTFSIDFYQTNSWDRYYDTNVLRASFGGLRSFTNSAPGAWNFDSIHFGQWSNFTVLSCTNLLP